MRSSILKLLQPTLTVTCGPLRRAFDKAHLLNFQAHLLSQNTHAAQIRIGENDGKLIATITGNQIARPGDVEQSIGNGGDDDIAKLEAEFIVDLSKIVDVHYRHADCQALPVREKQLLLQEAHQKLQIVQSRQRIDGGAVGLAHLQDFDFLLGQ